MIITMFKEAYVDIIPLFFICGISYLSCELIWLVICFLDKKLYNYITKNMNIRDDQDEQ